MSDARINFDNGNWAMVPDYEAVRNMVADAIELEAPAVELENHNGKLMVMLRNVTYIEEVKPYGHQWQQ